VVIFLLSCVSKKEAKKATRRLTALRVPSTAWKNRSDFAALSRFSACLGSQPIGGSQNQGELNIFPLEIKNVLRRFEISDGA